MSDYETACKLLSSATRLKSDDFGQCSGEMPCKACARDPNTCRAREPKYQWMHCMPFSLKEIDIFALCKSHRVVPIQS